MSGKVFQGSHLTIPFTEEGTLKGLEIQGVTEQESSEEISGTTVSGTTVVANDINISNGRISVYGNTEQEIREGTKNTLPFANKSLIVNGMEIKCVHGELILNGTTTAEVLTSNNFFKNNFKFKLAAGDYCFSAKEQPKISTMIKKVSDDSLIISLGVKEVTFSLTEDTEVYFSLYIPIGKTFNNFNYEFMLEKDATTRTTYESVGTPSILIPSDIRNVGDNINLYNKNALGYGNGAADYWKIEENGTITTTSNFSHSRDKGVQLFLEKNTDYTVSFVLNSMTFTGTNRGIVEILSYNEDNSTNIQVEYSTFTNEKIGKKIIFSFNSGNYSKWALHISGWYGTGNSGTLNYQDVKVEKGSIATGYSEYECGSIGFKKINKNLCKFERTVSANASASVEDNKIIIKPTVAATKGVSYIVLSYHEFEIGKKYTVSFKTEGNYRMAGLFSGPWTLDKLWSTSPYSFTLKEGDNTNLALGFYVDNSSINNSLTIYDVQIEENDGIATDYVEYQEETIVFPLEKGQKLHSGDYLARDGIHANKITVAFDGTETNWAVYTDVVKAGITRIGCVDAIKNLGVKNNSGTLKCSHFYYAGTSPDDTYASDVSSANFYFGIKNETLGVTDDTSNADKLIAWKNWVASQSLNGTPLKVEAELAEELLIPYTSEQTEIFEQLDNCELFTPYTYLTTTNETKAELKMRYNYVPALPNPENPQIIRNIGDNINLYNKDTITFPSTSIRVDIVNNEVIATRIAGEGGVHVSNLVENLIVGEKYTIKCNGEVYIYKDKIYGATYARTSDASNGFTFVASQNSYIISATIGSTIIPNIGDTFNCGKIKLERGTISTSYTPYNQGSIDIRITNENLFSGALRNGVKGNSGGLSYTDVNIYRYVDILLPVGTYKYKQFDTANFRLIRQANLTMKQDLKSPFTLSEPCVVSFTFKKADNTEWDLEEDASVIPFMLSKSDTDNSTLVQAKSQTVVLPLMENQLLHEGDEIRSDGIYTTKKTVTITDEDFLKYHGSAEIVEDGLIHWSCWGGLPTLGSYWSESPIVNCNIFDKKHFIKWGTMNNQKQVGVATYTGQIRVVTENIYGIIASDDANAKRQKIANYLKENNMILEMKLDEPILVPYTSEQNKIINNLSIYAPSTNIYVINNSTVQIVANSGDFIPIPRTELIQVLNEEPNLGTRVNLEIWSHEDEFIDTLYNTDYEFEGQCIDPKITLNANGSKTLTLSLPLYIIDKKTREFIENPRWTYITQQYKIRVQQDDRINEFVLKDYTESHDANDQLMININAQSLEEFELSQIGYNITFNENSLYRYNTNEDPNDPDTVPIGTYEPDIHFWNEKLLENSDWEYRVESYYPIDREMSEDNRQITNEELEYKNGKEQFYEEDRIIDYTEENEPIYSEEYEIKKRVVKAEKSNIFNIVQDICEAFECWPTFEIQYKDGKIVKKTIVYKNDVPQDATFSVNYQTNLNSIQRTVDSSQIVTKMYVTPIQNENVDNGIISISTNPKNFMKENYLLDLSWYLGDDRAETDIRNARLINPKIGMHFAGTNFSEPLFATTDTETTKDTIEVYKKNIRNRNTYIENMSLQLSKDQEELINLKTEREYVQSQKDAAQETVNTLIDEMSLIGNTELRKENKACYLYKQNDVVIIRFSEIGIKTVPNAETFNTPINILALDGTPFYEEGKVPAGTTNWKDIKTLQLVPYKVDPIIGTILECQVVNATIGTSTDSDYASFKCSFDYDPYDYYKKLISYWNAKIVAATDRLNLLGKSREDGGNSGLIYDLETKVIEEKRYVFQAQQQKAQVVKEFESKFNPYIREGYWENTDFGIYMNKEQSKTYIPDEFKVLKYGQTEDSSSEETDKYDWSKDYVSFKIPNVLISNAQGGTAYLYNIIDIEEIEVMNDDPLNKNDNFRTYVKGTDYSLEYGYTSLTPNVTASDRGIYIRFYESEVNTNNDYIPQFTANSQVYIRVKARGSNQYIWSGYSKAEYQSEGNKTKRKWFCPLEQRISIDDKDIILSSIVVKANTSKVTYDNNNNLIIDNTQYELKYGKDYYTSKEIENGVTLSRITFYQTTNTPLMDFQYANYTVEYNQDITAKYYYNDALDVMKDSSIPQTTYSINVLDISEAENFLSNLKWYKPQVGTRVPIYDEELRFKGLVGFINSITFDLLNPQNTQLSITNFKDKFVDLFQKITASTIALQSKEYEYDRSTQIVTVEGGISKNVLKDTFERPDSNFTVTPNSNIKWDYSGITSTSDKLNENGVYAQLKVTPNGIFTANSKDEFGNYVWTTAITPQGINASQLTIGKLDTRQIQIFNSSEPRFMWNETGLYAYGQNEGKTDYETYVLYNENGIKFRQLMKSTNKVILPNIVKSPTFTILSDWTLSSTDGSVFDTSNTGIVEEIEVVGASGVPTYQAVVASNKQTNNITFTLNSTKKDLVREHKYYFRVYVKANNIPELTNIDMNAGFTSFFKNIQYSQNNQYAKIDGFVTGVTDDNKFAVNVTLPNGISNWSVSIKKPMILDVTEIFGETIPSLQWFSDLTDIVEEGSWETDLDVYGDALRLDWGGLRIGAQDNSLQLTSQDGLVIYHPITTETNNERRMRLQLGQWKEVAVDEFGNPITNGTELVYEDLYGLRALDNNGNMIFKVTQRGVEFDFTSNLEETIRNYSAEAALGAIASTNTSNLLKNSCGYVYDAEIVDGKETGRYKQFYDWHVDNINYLFPIDEKFTQKNADGSESSIVEGTVSKHAFKMGGDTATSARPLIKQTVDVATSEGVVQPFTLKFLMKGISNTQTSSIKNGIHLEITEAGNQDDISVDIPYIGNGNWQVVKYTIYTEMRQVTISISNISTITVDSNNIPTNGVIYLSDLMFTSGKDTPAWTVSPGEVYNNYVTIGSEGVIVTSEKDPTGSSVRTVMDSHSFRVETINADRDISTNIQVTGDSTTLGPTHIKGQCDIGAVSRLRFIENADLEVAVENRNPGVDITLIKG